MKNRQKYIMTMLLAATAVAGIAPKVHAEIVFTALGDFPGGVFKSAATAVSGKVPSVVVGAGNSATGQESFRWEEGTAAMTKIGPSPYVTNYATGISYYADVIVGVGKGAYRWTASTGMVSLGDLPGGTFDSGASGTNKGGDVVVGWGTSVSGREAFRWTSSTGLVGLGDLPDGVFASQANAVSSDGGIVVGFCSPKPGQEAFRWTASTGMVGLGDLPEGIYKSGAMGISFDGKTIVGYANSKLGEEAFRYTGAGPMVGLGDLPGGRFRSGAKGVSGDGSVVVGFGTSERGEEAMFWNAKDGMVSLQRFLETRIGLPTDWALHSASAISADGKTIVGYGTHLGKPEAFLVRTDTKWGIL
jgi:probable HAF family extracellular repeat protein